MSINKDCIAFIWQRKWLNLDFLSALRIWSHKINKKQGLTTTPLLFFTGPDTLMCRPWTTPTKRLLLVVRFE